MSIRVQAWEAFTSSQQSRIAEHRAGLLSVLDGLTVDVDLAAVLADPQGRLTAVFTDGDVHLSVSDRDGWQVRVVAPDALGWAESGPPVGSLAEVSPYAPPRRDPQAPDAPAWQSGTLYASGDEVSHAGKVWKSAVDSNHWEPGAAGVYANIWAEVAS